MHSLLNLATRSQSNNDLLKKDGLAKCALLFNSASGEPPWLLIQVLQLMTAQGESTTTCCQEIMNTETGHIYQTGQGISHKLHTIVLIVHWSHINDHFS